MNLSEDVVVAFRDHYGADPDIVVRAPGRVNLIGEHVDYNGGFVLPMAIERAMWIAVRFRPDDEVHVLSCDFGQTARFTLSDFEYQKPHWCEYIKGVAAALKKRGHTLQGWDGAMLGNVPRGSGLSSSAALELAAAKAFCEVSNIPWDPVEMAVVGQEAENDWVGVNCGIMDQMISACGMAGHAYLLDCRSLEGTHVPLPTGVKIVILDTATRRGLVDSAYNERRSQCEEAAAFFGVDLLRDVSPEMFFAREAELPELTCKRARHVITEDVRTLAAADAMRMNDSETLGKLMWESHVSLRDDFEVSNEALNTLVDLAMAHESCLGARMTGAGFGGCAVALVREDSAAAFEREVAAAYQQAVDLEPAVYVTGATDGAQRL
ncbi:MAG: galactokinase [Verrucomicrobia bacterium]|nr:galactokinase [Verrucomicrobiota bacterium]MCH8528441.1 galactokinase [Kiritimatiellia bacterium]